ncbi:MAG: hypothetical protein HY321_08635 [Armatimonadetes bacterium]|nr:hypothetical protein [Armatimonadota bacterium]
MQTAFQFPSLEQPLDRNLLPPGTRVLPLDDPPEFYHGASPHLAEVVELRRLPKPVEAPLAQDITAGKNTYVYDAHTYHTKVPPQGIRTILEYYTRPGDVVLDPFCGSGMTGVAAMETGRVPILVDLSPAATFIAYNFLTPVDAESYMAAVHAIREASRGLEERLYGTQCPLCGAPTVCSYTVWSYYMVCSRCAREFQLWDVARDQQARVRDSKIRTEFPCPGCGVPLVKRHLRRTCREPVLIGSEHCVRRQKESTAPPTARDLELIAGIDYGSIPEDLWYPTAPFPEGVNTQQPVAAGIRSVDQTYTARNLWAMAYLWDVASRWRDPCLRRKLLFTLTSLYQRVTVFSEFRFWGGSGNIANYSVPAIMNEQNVFLAFERKARTISWYLESARFAPGAFRISTQSSCDLGQLPDGSIDFVFTDPPFGGNINYSEMNLLWESWLRVRTHPAEEAVINKVQGKGHTEYSQLLQRVFREVCRVLKEGGWLVVVFHNSSRQVWNDLQDALQGAGFHIRGTQTFDKRHGTFKQFVSANAVGYDLVLHCQKGKSRANGLRQSLSGVKVRAREFVERTLARGDREYVIRYLHVARDADFDYRRLYAEWLAATVREEHIRLSFDEFQPLVDQVANTLGIRVDAIVPDHPLLRGHTDETTKDA